MLCGKVPCKGSPAGTGGSEHLELHGAFSTSLRAPGTESIRKAWSPLRAVRANCLGGVAGCPRWDGESPRQGRTFLPVLAGSWGRELPFPVLKVQIVRALAG
jgi:hypothetical protein